MEEPDVSWNLAIFLEKFRVNVLSMWMEAKFITLVMKSFCGRLDTAVFVCLVLLLLSRIFFIKSSCYERCVL